VRFSARDEKETHIMATRWTTGIWKARALAVDLKRHEWGKSVANNPQIGIVMNIAQPRGTKREGVAYLTLSADAKEWSLQRLRLLGMKGTDLRVLDGIDRNYVDVDVSYEVFDGKERLKIEIVTPAKAQHKHALSPTELDALASMASHDLGKLPEVTLAVPPNAKGNGAGTAETEPPPDDFSDAYEPPAAAV